MPAPSRRRPLAARLVVGLALGGSGCAAAPAPDAVVLYSQATPAMRAALPAARCAFYPIESFRPTGRHAATVVLAGHSLPPTYLNQPAEVVARAIASFTPELVVLDTCYGASTPILEALVATGLKATVVAPPYRIPEDGFVYAPDFLDTADPRARAERVRTEPSFPLLRWSPEAGPLSTLQAGLATWSAPELRRHLKLSDPPLVKTALPTLTGPGNQVLVPVAVERFRVKTAP